MDKDSNTRFEEAISEALNKSVNEIESLKEYYVNSKQDIETIERKIKKDYEIGLFINEKIIEAYDLKDINLIKKAIGEFGNNILPDGTSVSNYISVFFEIDKEKNEPVISYKLNLDAKIDPHFLDPVNAMKEYDKINQYTNILTTSILSYIIIIFERYLTQIYEVLLLSSPKKYFENKKIDISTIFNKNIKEIVQECTLNEVEKNMYDSLNTLELISRKEGIDINRYRNIQDDFEEIYYRRNLYVHNEGYVNETYLSNIKDKFKTNISLHKKLATDESYLLNSINILYKVVCTLYYEIQGTRHFSDKNWLATLEDVGFKLLNEKNYDVSEHIYYILSQNKSLEFADKALYRVNYIIALKQQGKADQVKKELKALDFSAATDKFKIAKLCLEDKNEEAYLAINKNYPEPFAGHLIRDWPLFIDFRKSKYYSKLVEEHQDDFELYLYDNGDSITTDEEN